jgi:uncharacterized protein YdhG (YjbR/CyaY superfamily)
MKKSAKPPETIDEYIALYPTNVQAILKKIRTTIRKAIPAADEAIKYGLPTFVLSGNVIHFGAFKHHIGVYPAPRGLEKFKKELAAYEGSKGAVKFPLDRPIPYDLIARIAKFRAKDNLERAAAKKKKR